MDRPVGATAVFTMFIFCQLLPGVRSIGLIDDDGSIGYTKSLRFAPEVPVSIRPGVAGGLFVLQAIRVVVEWSYAPRWRQITAFVPFLSTTGVAAGISLMVTLCVVALGATLSWRDLGWAPRPLATATALGASCWGTNQLIQLVDSSINHSTIPLSLDLSGAFLNAYSEELLFRLLLLGGIRALLGPRTEPRHALRLAIGCSSVLFVAWHIPHDIVVGGISPLLRYPSLFVYGVLMCLVYLRTGSLMISVVLHMLGNEPALVVAGPHVLAITTTVNWTVCVVVIVFANRYRRQPGRAAS